MLGSMLLLTFDAGASNTLQVVHFFNLMSSTSAVRQDRCTTHRDHAVVHLKKNITAPIKSAPS
eukprot:scaffold12220_cov204-Skeletonema_marinoi.AAC.7